MTVEDLERRGLRQKTIGSWSLSSRRVLGRPDSSAAGGSGALSSLETTVLLTVDETMDALRKAEQVQYRAPGA